jgi:peptidoglycan hydrolase-like protein with peptidoglycan-binding domain
MRRRTAIGGAAVVAAGAAGAALLAGGGHGGPEPARAAVGATAVVERRNLVDRATLSGTLGYAEAGTISAATAGVITWLPREGSVVRRGATLYRADNAPAAFLLYGRLPAWRDLVPGMSDGPDVRQLERNLRALGYDAGHDMTIDRHWDWATTAAVERFQDARGLTVDGSLARGEIVFRSGPTRVGQLEASVGDTAAPGRALAKVSSTSRRVTVEVPADRQSAAREGDTVTVGLPSGQSARGQITDVGTVAETPPDDPHGDPTVPVTIRLRGRAAHGTRLDQAPVDVGFAVERRKGVLAVPIKALLARPGGGFAVEVVENGAHRLVPVEPGLYADDEVEVSGDLHEGETVVTAR